MPRPRATNFVLVSDFITTNLTGQCVGHEKEQRAIATAASVATTIISSVKLIIIALFTNV